LPNETRRRSKGEDLVAGTVVVVVADVVLVVVARTPPIGTGVGATPTPGAPRAGVSYVRTRATLSMLACLDQREASMTCAVSSSLTRAEGRGGTVFRNEGVRSRIR
jgi:hypothetical protein